MYDYLNYPTPVFISTWLLLLMGFKLMAGAVASCALIGVAVGVGIIYGSLLISIGRNPSQRDELLRSSRYLILQLSSKE